MNPIKKELSRAIQAGLILGTVGLAGFSGLAVAQADQDEMRTLDRVEVTGSRIRQVDVETAQPVLSISRQEIESKGFSSVADLLQNIPAAGQTAISRSAPLSAGENAGGYYISLRNLGATRSLILVNGKRVGITTAGLQDISSIPISIIERVDVLLDGASSIYGSDAMAGVVNIITRQNYSGAEANVYYGEYSQGDGRRQTYDFVLGITGDRGSITVAAEYHDEEGVWASDRWFSRDSYPGYPQFSTTVVGQWGNFNINSGLVNADGDPLPAQWWAPERGSSALGLDNFRPQTGIDTSVPNDQMHVYTPLERRSLFVSGAYDISDSVRFSTDLGYNKRSSWRQIAGYPFQSTSSWGVAPNTNMPAESYFNPLGIWHGADDPRTIQWRRRGWEVPRVAYTDLTTWRFVGQFDGTFEFGDRYFAWDAGFLYNNSNQLQRGRGDFDIRRVLAATGPSFMNEQGRVQCGTPENPIGFNACIPWNPFAGFGTGNDENSLANPDLQNFLFPWTHNVGDTKTTSYFANLDGTLFSLPAGDLAFAVGYEYRREKGEFVPDALAQAGGTSTLAAGATRGQYSIDEFYAELDIPILADMTGFQELSLSLASRYSDYSTFGDTLNSKVGLRWRPIEDLLVRGTWSQGFRAPAIANLFGGGSQTFPGFTDPCDTLFGVVGGSARCLQDVPADFRQLQQGFVPAPTPGSQTPVPFFSGANPLLTPETSRSKTLGLVYSPNYVEGLNLALDWWHIKIDNTLVGDSPNQILNDCYVEGIESRCALFTRDPQQGFVNSLNFGLRNAGYVVTEGYDFNLNYRLETDFGRFNIGWNNTYVSRLSTKSTNDPEAVESQQNSIYGGNFRLRSNATIGWEIGDFGITYGARYFSAVKDNCFGLESPDPECNIPNYAAPQTGGNIVPLHRRGSNTFHDIQFSWSAPWNATIALGANNVTNHFGPAIYGEQSPGRSSNFAYYGNWDIGRFVYARYQQRF